MIHIEGMGWMGSMLALRLHAEQVPFTWHDTASRFTAWKASTGLVYPAGDARSAADLQAWRGWAAASSGPSLPVFAAQPVDYLYTQKTPPHGGPPPRVAGSGWSMSSGEAVQVDVQVIVAAARRQFAGRRQAGPGVGDRVVRAHGFTDRLRRYVWGWSRPVQLRLRRDVGAVMLHPAAAIYCRQGRFVMAYAYPIPSRPGWWWAGSSLVPQRTPHRLDADKHYATWQARFEKLAPFARVEAVGEITHGWRPQPDRDDSGFPELIAGQVVFPPLWHSGVRWTPSTIDRAMELL